MLQALCAICLEGKRQSALLQHMAERRAQEDQVGVLSLLVAVPGNGMPSSEQAHLQWGAGYESELSLRQTWAADLLMPPKCTLHSQAPSTSQRTALPGLYTRAELQ